MPETQEFLESIKSDDTVAGGAELVPVFCTAKVPTEVRDTLTHTPFTQKS